MKLCPVCSAAFVGDFVFCPRDGRRLDIEGDDRLIGQQVDRFRIEARIGSGRLGRAYRARLGEKQYAVKVLVGDLSADRAMVKRFRQTAHLLSKVRHKHVSEIVEFDTTSSGLAFVAANYVPSQTLAEFIKREAPVSREVADLLIRDIAEGLAAAHAQGLVYRDVRPGTVRVTERGGKWRATIADFSLNGLRPPVATLAEPSLRYAAPECLEEHVGPASDLYALGVMLADLVEGGPADGHPLLPLLLHRLPEGRLQSAKAVVEELKGERRRRAARTDDLELTVVPASNTPAPAPAAEPEPIPLITVDDEWASHFDIADPPDPVVDREGDSPDPELPDEPEVIEVGDIESSQDILEVVVGRPEQTILWPTTQRALVEMLVTASILTKADRDLVLDEVASSHRRLLQVIQDIRPEFVERATKWLSAELGLEMWIPNTQSIHPRVLATIPKALATELGVVPHALRAEEHGNTLFVAVSDPVEKPTRQAIEAMVNHPVVWALASPEHVDAALEAAYGKEVRQGVPATMRIRRPKM